MPIIRTGLPILVELIDMANSFTFKLHTTLLRWLTFLLGSQTMILAVLVFWISFFPDASICSTIVLAPLGNSDHVVVSVSIDFPSYSQSDAPFHRTAYNYSCADWDGFPDHLRDAPYL